MGQKVEQGRHIDMHRSLDVFRHGYMLQMCRAEECSAEEGSNLCQTNRFVVCRHLSGQRGLTGMQGHRAGHRGSWVQVAHHSHDVLDGGGAWG